MTPKQLSYSFPELVTVCQGMINEWIGGDSPYIPSGMSKVGVQMTDGIKYAYYINISVTGIEFLATEKNRI